MLAGEEDDLMGLIPRVVGHNSRLSRGVVLQDKARRTKGSINCEERDLKRCH